MKPEQFDRRYSCVKYGTDYIAYPPNDYHTRASVKPYPNGIQITYPRVNNVNISAHCFGLRPTQRTDPLLIQEYQSPKQHPSDQSGDKL